MKNSLYFAILTGSFILFTGCIKPGNKKSTANERNTDTVNNMYFNSDDDMFIEFSFVPETVNDVTGFIPEGYILFEEISGDLNKDDVDDIVLIIKGTDEDNIIVDEYRGELDRNRRGIIVLLNRGDHYEAVSENYDCFPSENEDGGVYFAPDLYVHIEKGNLYIHYAHGRYGYWKYTFRYQNSDFELIGYDSSESNGPVINREVSINYSTKKMLERVNVNNEAESGEEVFEETWSDLDITKLDRLSEMAAIE